MTRNLTFYLLMVLIIFNLFGCGALLVGGSAYKAKQIADHPGSFNDISTDTYLEFMVTKALRLDKILAKRWLACDVNDRIVVVNGQVKTDKEKQRVDKILSDIQGLDKIINKVMITDKPKKLRFDDLGLALKIKLALMRDRLVKSSLIEVYSNKYRVFLSGIVATRKEEARIITLAEEQGAWLVKSFIVVRQEHKD